VFAKRKHVLPACVTRFGFSISLFEAPREKLWRTVGKLKYLCRRKSTMEPSLATSLAGIFHTLAKVHSGLRLSRI
jgi:hypothetical protein